MKRPWSKDDYQREFADEIIEQIKRGVAPWQKPWKPGERSLAGELLDRESLHRGEQHLPGCARTAQGIR